MTSRSPDPSLFQDVPICEQLREIAESIVDTSTAEGRTLLHAARVIEWLLPGVAERRPYGVSSAKLIRHCVLGEPLDDWHRPWDHHDMLGVMVTAEAAPKQYRERACAAIAVWMAQLDPKYREKVEKEIAAHA